MSSAFLLPAPIFAQDADVVPGRPEHPEIDAQGVSVTYGQYNLDSNDISIGGVGNASGIALHRQYPSGYLLATSSTTVKGWLPFGWAQTHNYDIRLYCALTQEDYDSSGGLEPSCGFRSFYLVIGSDVKKFDQPVQGVADYRSSDGSARGYYYDIPAVNGAVATSGFDFVLADGTIYKFMVASNGTVNNYKNRCNGYCWFVDSLKYKNGEYLKFSYESATVFNPSRLLEVNSSYGYGAKFSYLHAATKLTSADYYDPRALYVNKVESFHQNCSISPCARTYDSVVQYYYNSLNGYYYLARKVASDGASVQYGWTGAGYMEDLNKVYLPNSTTATSVDLTYAGGKVTELRNAYGSKWTYNYLSGSTEVVDPAGAKTTYALTTVADEPRITQVTDAAGLVSKYGYNSVGMISSREKPGGVRWDYTYDADGNLTSTVVTPRASSGLSAITTTSTFDACTSSNLLKCHSPTSSVDGEGNRTNYSWSVDHGGLLSETHGLNSSGVCALAGGICPTTTYGYTSYTGIDGALFYKQTSMQEMLDATRTRSTTWEYGTAADRFALKSEVRDSAGLAVRSCYRFDAVGNLIARTDFQSGLAACPQM